MMFKLLSLLFGAATLADRIPDAAPALAPRTGDITVIAIAALAVCVAVFIIMKVWKRR